MKITKETASLDKKTEAKYQSLLQSIHNYSPLLLMLMDSGVLCHVSFKYPNYTWCL